MRQAMLSLISMIFVSMSAQAQPSDESRLRQRAGAIKAEATKLAESGRKEEALRLVAVADELTAIADHPDSGTRLAGLGSELDALKARRAQIIERHEKASRLIRSPDDPTLQKLRHDIVEIQQEIKKREVALESARKIDEAPERIQHLRIAAEHLKQAGMLDISRQLLVKAAAQELEIAEAQERATVKSQESPKPAEPQKSSEVEEMRQELGRVRAELDELRKQIKPK